MEADLQDGQVPSTTAQPTREDVLLQCFQKLDKDKSGWIELSELRFFASKDTPQTNLQEARRLLSFLDADGDRRVSLEEYTAAMGLLTTLMPDEEFETAFCGALAMHDSEVAGEQLVGGPMKYMHPQGSRKYLEAQVIPQLQQGLAELIEKAQTERLKLAAGTNWEDGKYLPHDWRPFSPLRWLADWLQQHINELSPGGQLAFQLPLAARPFDELSREEKIALAFQHLDRDKSGRLDQSELLALAGRVRGDDGTSRAEKLLESMDLNRDGMVDLNEYTSLLMQLTIGLPDDEFDEGVRSMLSSGHLSYCKTREEKLSYLFTQLDLDHSGQISHMEIADLARRLDPKADEQKVAATMAALGGTDVVNQAQFVAALDVMLAAFPNNMTLDAVIMRLLDARSAAEQHDCADEVQPEKLAELARTFITHKLAPQEVACGLSTAAAPADEKDNVKIPRTGAFSSVTGTDIMDKLYQQAPLLLIDVRSLEEQAVSSMPGAVSAPCKADPTSAHGWIIPEGILAPVKSRLAALLEQRSRQALVIVVYCNTGERGGAVALSLSSRLGGAQVYNMCGGLINYYNQGGNLTDPTTGKPVQAVHPGGIHMQGYVTRPNKYKH